MLSRSILPQFLKPRPNLAFMPGSLKLSQSAYKESLTQFPFMVPGYPHPICPGGSLVHLPAFQISRYRRKHGLYSYKLGKNQRHKNPHAIPLKSKEYMKAQGYQGQLKIRERERLSNRPFGRHTSRGKFIFDIERVPYYNVPDLTDFKLKPYVPHLTPKVPEDRKVERIVHLSVKMKR